MLSAAAGAWSVEVEAFLHGGSEQPLPHDVLRGIFRKLQVVHARVDRRVARVGCVHLRSHTQSESWTHAHGGFQEGGLTFLTMVRRGCKLASPPGGSVEQPVVNCRKAFRSSDDIPHKTLTKRRKPGLRGPKERRGQQERTCPKPRHQHSTWLHRRHVHNLSFASPVRKPDSSPTLLSGSLPILACSSTIFGTIGLNL